MTEENKPQGIGGWLILVGIGIIISPIRIAALLIGTHKEIFTSGQWDILTTPGSESYNLFWAPFLLTEIAGNISLIVLWLYIFFLFFSKKKAFPSWYVFAHIFSFAFILMDAFAIKLVLPKEEVFDTETLKEVIRSFLGILIWVPYIYLSKRVKNTFVQ